MEQWEEEWSIDNQQQIPSEMTCNMTITQTLHSKKSVAIQ